MSGATATSSAALGGVTETWAGGRENRLLSALLLVLPILAWAYCTWIAPRPYYVAQDDMESGSYFGALMLRDGIRPTNLHAPGITTNALTAAVEIARGGAWPSPQAVFVVLRLLAAVITGLAMWFVVRFSFRHDPVAVICVALIPVIAWPSSLRYFEYFDPNCLQAPFALVTIGVFWSVLEGGARSQWRRLAVCGILLGVSLATKFTFVPIAVAVLVTAMLRSVRRDGSFVSRWAEPLALLSATAATFCLIMVPAIGIGEVPRAVLSLRGTALPSDWRGSLFLPSGWLLVFRLNWLVGVLVLVCAVTLVLRVARRQPHALVTAASRVPGVSAVADFDAGSATVFFVLMLLALNYTMVLVAGDGPPGVLGKTIPSASFLPFLIVHLFRQYRNSGLFQALKSGAVPAAVIVLASVAIATPIYDRAGERHAFIQAQLRAERATPGVLLALRSPGTRIAVYEESPGPGLGGISFDFWGNYIMASGRYDEALLQKYPDYTFLRLREVPKLLRATAYDTISPSGTSAAQADSPFGWPGRTWRSLFPRQDVHLSDELFAGEWSGVCVSLVAFHAEAGQRMGVTPEALLGLVRIRMGPASLRRQRIEDIDWILISVEPRWNQQGAGGATGRNCRADAAT